MLTRSQYDYLKDTILNDPGIGLNVRDLMMGLLFIYFKRDMPNFNQKKWLMHLDINKIKERVENDTSHTLEDWNTKSNT